MTPHPSTAFAASQLILPTAGLFYSVACTINSAKTAGDYHLILLDALTLPANGSDVTQDAFGKFLAWMPVTHSTLVMDTFTLSADDFGFPSDTGFRCKSGCLVLLSSTGPTSITAVATSIVCNPSVK